MDYEYYLLPKMGMFMFIFMCLKAAQKLVYIYEITECCLILPNKQQVVQIKKNMQKIKVGFHLEYQQYHFNPSPNEK